MDIIKGCIALAVTALTFVGCSNDKDISAVEHTQNAFEELLGGDYNTMQWWQTAVKLKVEAKADEPTDIYAYFVEGDRGTMLDYQFVNKDTTFYMTVPQSSNTRVVLMAKEEKQMVTQDVILTGAPEQTVALDVNQLKDNTRSTSRATRAGQSLYGTDILRNIGYTEVNREGIDIVTQYTTEGMDIEKRGLNGNYELISQGPFKITMFYGFTGCNSSRILGYYRHSPGTYQDLELVDMVDTHAYDYINGEAKLQYQLDGIDTWYDSNFDYRDGYTAPFTTMADRLGDDAYNIQHVMNKYGNRMTKARGLTWEINVKPGDRIGFYLKMEGRQNSAQRELDVKRGLPSGRLPNPMYETNWSAKVLNTDGKHRSVLIQDHGYTIITVPDIDVLLPSVEKQVWTIAYEDVWRDNDFDFNDAVIRIQPDDENETCGITLMAVGSSEKMYLHYDGPDGDQNLGEIHELFRQKRTTKVNTTTAYATVTFVELDKVKWLRNYTVSDDAKRFYIEVQRGTCEDCGDLLTLPYEPGVMPQAILVAGNWHWPMEGVHITTAYNKFSPWAIDMSNLRYWNWHTAPQPNTTVAFE